MATRLEPLRETQPDPGLEKGVSANLPLATAGPRNLKHEGTKSLQ